MQKKLIVFLFLSLAIASRSTMASNETIFFDLGVFALEEGNTAKARQYFKQALAFSKDNPLFLQYLGKTDLADAHYDSAHKQFASAWQLNPDLSGLPYDLATTYFQQKAYDQALQLFEKAIQQNTDAEQTVIAHFCAGISYFHKKKYEQAIPHFLTAAESTPDLKDSAFLYAGICLYHQHDWTLAENYLKQVHMHAAQRELRQRASKWLQAVQAQRIQFKPFDLFCKFGMGYDDNVELNSPENDSDSDDFVSTVFMYGRYHLVNAQDYKLGIAYGHYQTIHPDTTEVNLINSTVMVYAMGQKQAFQWMTEISPSYYWLDSDRFLSRFQWRLRTTFNIENVIFPYLVYSYTLDDHFQDDHRDANRNGIGLGVSFMFQPDVYKLQTLFSSEKTSSAHQDHNYEMSKAQLSLNLFVHPLCTLTLLTRCGLRDHEHIDSIQHIKRKDKNYHARLGVQIPLKFEGLSADISYQWSKNDSNIHDYDYRKNLIAVYLTLRQ
ncbi:MAG: tetratricopeptide repeat protein [Candidatus Magnetomorum sp.]|nr:tetratricopeptide repeat protein [Candidatus Magnetomorum sp.]